MSGREKKSKARAKETMSPTDPVTKQQKKIIHWVRKNVPTKKTRFLHSHVVEYFCGSKAVDALINDSPWAKKNAKEDEEIVFEFRESAVEFLDEMLKHKMFHRANKIPVKEKEKKSKKGKKDAAATTDADDNTEKDEANSPKSAKGGEGDGKGKEKKKRRKIRLDMHLEQLFLDNQDAYVWLYDPIPWYYWAGGTLIVLGIVAVCLFPLWPPMMRKGVHYLSVAAAGFLIFIIALGIIKYIIFAALFALTGGKLKFWIFPNLTEDVGFLESFMPIYDYTYTGASWRRKKAKDSDDEESDDEEESENEESKEKSSSSKSKEEDEDGGGSSSAESTSRKSSTGKDFEIVDNTDSQNE